MKQMKISGFSDEISQNLEEQLTYVNQLGMDYVCLRGVNGKNIGQMTEYEIKREVLPMLYKYNIQVSSLGTGIGKVFISDREAVESQLEMAKQAVENAKLLRCKYIRIFSFYIPLGEKISEFRGEILEYISKITEIFAKENIIAIHENEKNIYGDTGARCLDLLKEMNSPYFRAVFDFANFVQVGENPWECYQLLEPYIVYFHIKDSVYQTGKNVICGQGEGQIEKILKQAFESGYEGFLTLEPHLSEFEGRSTLELEDRNKIDVYGMDGKAGYKVQYEALKKCLKKI